MYLHGIDSINKRRKQINWRDRNFHLGFYLAKIRRKLNPSRIFRLLQYLTKQWRNLIGQCRIQSCESPEAYIQS